MSIVPPKTLSEGAQIIRLRCGTLTLRVENAHMPLEELCTFGSRRSRKRGFLIISKVLGKHVPVRPSVMQRVNAQLVRQIGDVQGGVVVVALAETATGLGQGVFEEFLRSAGRDDVLFMHSTRYRLNHEVALTFGESHSHAMQHFLYRPIAPRHRQLFDNARTLVIVDDELTTGRTLANLAREYIKVNPHVATVRFVCITDWIDGDRRRAIPDEIARPTEFHALLRGTLHFTANPDFEPGSIPDVVGHGEPADFFLPMNHGRLGADRPVRPDFDQLQRQSNLSGGERVLVLGTGEFSHSPFLFARHLEQRGWDVQFQSTTRSPILVGEGIASTVEFTDNYHDEIPNFVYNVAADRYDRILIGYETRPLPASHRLAEMLGGQALFFGGPGT